MRRFVVFFLLLASCVSDPVTGKSRLGLVQWSVEEELELGRQMAPSIEAQYDAALLDTEAQDYLRRVVLEMTELSVRKDDFDFTFTILNSSIPNAFALPGGYVYVTRGLLQELESEGQFVSVMGHELGHVEHQHAMASQSRGLLLGLPGRTIATAGGLVLGDSALVNTVAGLAGFAPALVDMKFDRGQEIEADARGVYFADGMGYDPREGVKTFELFERMEEQAGAGGLGSLTIFSTHPSNPQRIERMRDLIAEEYPDVATREASSFRTGDRFTDIVARLRERAPAYALYDEGQRLLYGDDVDEEAMERALGKMEEASELLPDEPVFHVGLGELQLVREELEDSILHLVEAMRLYEVHPRLRAHWKPPFYLGLFSLEAGEPEAAVVLLRKSVESLPTHAVLHLYLGMAYEEVGDTVRAIEAYRFVVDMAPRGSKAYDLARARLKELT